ncbi:MAG TPA: endonuclease/exonuclease/phosphatase family protein [Longimicrobiales bacterium]|nr:endonuclease/exonuclease/phosphatase family protein [Longimicrobiales bacterium]
MRTGPIAVFRSAIVLLLTVAFAACADEAETPVGPDLSITAHEQVPGGFSVYTQNVYLGGDTGPLFALDLSDTPAVIAATADIWQDVQASDPVARMMEVVDEIEDSAPHMIGLQEMLRFIVLDAAFQPIGAVDFLATLESEIQARGLPYVTEVVQEATSATMPLAFDPAVGISRWLNFTDRLVTLRRTDVEPIESTGGVYAARIPLGPLDVVRGWTRAAVEHAGTTFHFVNTHLETQQAPPVQAGQAAELQDVVLAGLEGITVLVGDLNSDAAGEPGDATWTPTYGDLVDAGFIDSWEVAPPGVEKEGLTCCQDPGLTGAPQLYQRIDFVLVRASGDHGGVWGRQSGAFRADIVGEEETDLTPGGLWPSDHAGLKASMLAPLWGGL